MRRLSISYKVIAVVSFLILSAVQFFLLYNTYKLENELYYVEEKQTINQAYGQYILNDNVFPGGSAIIDKYIHNNLQQLERLYKTNDPAFDVLKQKVCDSLFSEMITRNNVDSIFEAIKSKHRLSPKFEYALFFSQLELAFVTNKYVPLYHASQRYELFSKNTRQTPWGIRLAGTLEDVAPQNNIIELTVSSAQDYSYKLMFKLFADKENRTLSILKAMVPTFLLSLLSIAFVLILFLVTFRNWQKQKKLADMKSDFVNSITHEFHTPLATIMIANKNLQNEKILEKRENIKPLTDVIFRQATRLKYLFGQVLDIAIMDKTTLQKTEYALPELLDEIIYDYRLKLAENNVSIQYEADPDLQANAMLDRFWFTTMLLNLFENGIKYNDKDVKTITVQLTVYNKVAEIAVTDNGVGMSEKTMQHIYDKFYRSTAKKDDVSGLGLGLFYTKQCVEAHEWKIKLESREGIGSTFTIVIQLV